MVVRTESKVVQVRPEDEQQQIDFMHQFYWNLLSSQEIRSIDNHLETRGDNLYSVTKTDHYVKLAFSRDVKTPHLDKIKNLENEFFSLPIPKYPKLFPGSGCLWAILFVCTFFVLVPFWCIYFVVKYLPDKARAERQIKQLQIDRQEIKERLKQYETID
jgi:hypothetical protein